MDGLTPKVEIVDELAWVKSQEGDPTETIPDFNIDETVMLDKDALMAGRTFDCVLDSQMHPVYNGTPEQVRKWVELNLYWLKDAPTFTVCPGATMRIVDIQKYLEGFSISPIRRN